MWKRVDECQPPSGMRVLVFVSDESRPRIEISVFDDSEWRWDGLDDAEVTHWAELPPFPSPCAPDSESPAFFDKKKQQQLYDHLCKEFDSTYAEFCLATLQIDIEAYLDADQDDSPTDADWREMRAASEEAYHLYDLCNDNQALEEYSSACYVLAGKFMKIARDTKAATSPKSRPGRPSSTKIRNELICHVYGLYSKKRSGDLSAGSHFEETVATILGWVEPSPPGDMHSAIMRCINKCKGR